MQMKKYLSYLGLCLAFLLYGCNEDDVFEIFANGQTWYWSSSYDTTNWEDDNKWDMTLSIDDVARINSTKDSYYIRFSDDGTVEGKGNAITFSGRWSANGEDHSFSINIKSDRTPSGLDKTFFDEISNAKFYRGDATLIKLFNIDKNHFIQFSTIRMTK